ncbi:MAG: hypothetical protein ACFB00_09075 [Parvularculaceae bacterium]
MRTKSCSPAACGAGPAQTPDKAAILRPYVNHLSELRHALRR